MDRRTFLSTGAVAIAAPLAAHATLKEPLRIAVIGHTGRGNFGHGLDTVWLRLPETQIVGVADRDSGGLSKALKRLKLENGFDDYQRMLKSVKPDIVAVCPRHPDQHCDMILAAIDSGARGVYVEKPFCRTPAESDRIIAAAEKHNCKVAVAHRNRYHPTLQAIDALIADGSLGRLLEIRGRGKGDRRGGGEDLWVLGSHTVNLINYFGGRPLSCSAVMKQSGRPVVRADVKDGNEALGPLAGDEVHARYEMERGFVAYFDSMANDQTGSHAFGLQIIGSKGVVSIRIDRHPLAHFVPGNPFEPTSEPRPWIPITSAGIGKPEPREDLVDYVSHHVGPARNLIETLDTDAQPLCSAYEGATTLEMICGVFESHRQNGAAVQLPLEERGNSLLKL